MVEVYPKPKPFLFSTIYASPNLMHRKLLWQNLKCIANTYLGPWLLGGDFNEIIFTSEKFEGRVINIVRANLMLECFNFCNLIDLGYRGSRYTWTNKMSQGLWF